MTLEEYKEAKVGDIVKCLVSFEGYPQEGNKGKIINKNSDIFSVKWEESFKMGHTCSGLCEMKHGRNYFTDREATQNISTLKLIGKNIQLNLFD